MNYTSKAKTDALIKKGVRINSPESVEIGDEINIDRISGNGVFIYSGCKLFGKNTLIMRNTKIGHEGPATVENCQMGPEVELKSGFFKDSVFLQKVKMGYGAHVREGTIVEEEASVAHTVALKQTILFPFVTLGSLINFCDCLMAGGTGRKHHSEVGSSFIHFNFTPNQDKATASLFGDVPHGVMLNQNPIFLGGQGGIVGPIRLAFGITTAAGTICRKDELRPDRLVLEVPKKSINIPFVPGSYPVVKRIVLNNIIYIANLIALDQWYSHVRPVFLGDDFTEPLLNGMREKLDMGITERIKRLKELSEKIHDSKSIHKTGERTGELHARWPDVEQAFHRSRTAEGDHKDRNIFLNAVKNTMNTTGTDYISFIKGLHENNSATGSRWLQGIVDHVTSKVLETLPGFQ